MQKSPSTFSSPAPRRLSSYDSTSISSMKFPTHTSHPSYSSMTLRRQSQTYRSSPLAGPAVSSNGSVVEANPYKGKNESEPNTTTGLNSLENIAPMHRARSLSSDSKALLQHQGTYHTHFPTVNDNDNEFGTDCKHLYRTTNFCSTCTLLNSYNTSFSPKYPPFAY